MKKYIVFFLVMMFPALFFSACSPEEDDIFEKPSSQRMDDFLANAKEVLESAPNGWLMEYFPSKEHTYGGYNVLLDFSKEKGKVYAINDISGVNTLAGSTYSLKQSAGGVLSFDGYNEAIHFFSKPQNIFGPLGKGMEGDVEFNIMEATKDSVVLQGRKMRDTIVVRPFTADTTMEDYIELIHAASKKMYCKYYKYEVNGKTFDVNSMARSLIITYTNDKDEAMEIEAPYLQTLTGFKFNSPLKIDGVEVSELIYKEDEDCLVASNGADAVLRPVYKLNEALVTTNTWCIPYKEAGKSIARYWDAAVDALDTIQPKQKIDYMYIAKSRDTTIQGIEIHLFGLNYQISVDGVSEPLNGYIGLSREYIGDDKIQFSVDELSSLFQGKTTTWYIENAGFNNFIAPLIEKSPVYTITADNLKDPNWLKLQADNDPDNYFTLYKNVVPFKD